MSIAKQVRCVHCLRFTEKPEADHVFPKSWYPDSTPATVQRWTVPSCPKCNRMFGQLETDLLSRLALSLDTNSESARGLDRKAFRSMGIDVQGLPEDEKNIREKRRTKIRSEFLPYDEFGDLPARIPGLGPRSGEAPGPVVLFPWAGFSIVAEKIARGCEYKYANRFVESPYDILTLKPNSESATDEPMATEIHNFGPGFNVKRWSAPQDRNVVGYWITLWDTLHMMVAIDFEEEITEMKKRLPKAVGVIPPAGRAMQVPEYLRSYQE